MTPAPPFIKIEFIYFSILLVLLLGHCLFSLTISSSEIVMQRCLFFIGRYTISDLNETKHNNLHFQFVAYKSCESCFVINEQPWVSNVHSKICIFYYENIFTVCDVNRKGYCNGTKFAAVTGTYQLEARLREVHYNSKENFMEVSASLTLYDITNLNSHFVYLIVLVKNEHARHLCNWSH